MLITIIQGTDFESICEYIKTAIFKFNVRRVRAPNSLKYNHPNNLKLMYFYEDTPFGFYADFCPYYKVELEDVDSCIVFIFCIPETTFEDNQIEVIKNLLADKMLTIKNDTTKIKHE